MKIYFKLPPVTHMSDVHLMGRSLEWGDRTRTFICDRDDRARENRSVLDLYGQYRDTIAFFYIQSSGGLPSRVERSRQAGRAAWAA